MGWLESLLEVTPVHGTKLVVRVFQRSGFRTLVSWKIKVILTCCNYKSHHTVKREDYVAWQTPNLFFKPDEKKDLMGHLTCFWVGLSCEHMHIYGHPLTINYRVTLWLWYCRKKGSSSHCRKLFGRWPAPIKIVGECFWQHVCVLCLEQSSCWRLFVLSVPILLGSLRSFLDNPLNGTPKSDNAPLCQQKRKKKKKTGHKEAGFAFVSMLQYEGQ